MDFGLFYYCQGRGVPHDQAYAEMLDQITLAEALGFGECWFAEHHFTDYSILPSPNVMIAAALARTTRMRFGNYVNVMPFHHPLRLAAEAAMLANLARGRFDFGIGKGVRPGEFAKLGLQFDDATAMTDEAIEIVLKAWTGEACTHEGRFWRFPELSLRPRPFQRPRPSRCTSRRRTWSLAVWRSIARPSPLAPSPRGTAPTVHDSCCAARPTWPRPQRSLATKARWRSRGSGISRRSRRLPCRRAIRTSASRS